MLPCAVMSSHGAMHRYRVYMFPCVLLKAYNQAMTAGISAKVFKVAFSTDISDAAAKHSIEAFR